MRNKGINPNIKTGLIEILESEKPFKEFTRRFSNLNEAYSFYADYAQEKWKDRKGRSREPYYVLHWQKFYSNTDSYLYFVAKLELGKLSAQYYELNFTTSHQLEEKEARQLQTHAIAKELLNALVLLLAIPTGGLTMVAVGNIVSAITSSSRENLPVGIIMLIIATVLILLTILIKQNSLTLGMLKAIKSVGKLTNI